MRRNCVSFVITLTPTVSPHILEALKKIGIHNCTPLPAVDLRRASPHQLRQAGIISPLAHLALVQGRCNDHMLSSTAAVGCYISHLMAAQKVAGLSPDSWALVLEEDCKLNAEEIQSALLAMDRENDDFFDLIGIGVKRMRECSPNPSIPCAPLDAEEKRIYGDLEMTKVEGTVMEGTHCLLYTVEGAKKMVRLLGSSPIEMQIDSALSCLTTGGQEDFRLWRTRKGASQRLFRASTIQDLCVSCRLRGNGYSLLGVFFVFLMIFGLTIVAVRSRYK